MIIKKAVLLVLCYLSIFQVSTVVGDDTEYFYYHSTEPKMVLSFKANKEYIGVIDNAHYAKSCEWGNKEVCIVTENNKMLFTIPNNLSSVGKTIEGTSIVLKSSTPKVIENVNTNILVLESIDENLKNQYTYSPHFGLMAITFTTDKGQGTYISNNKVGYGAIEPIATEN